MQLLQKFNKERFFLLLAFVLPLIFYFGIFFGKSFGFDCAQGVMGNYPPYEQVRTNIYGYCITILDPGAYTWQHPAHWVSMIRQYLSGHLPIWDQNIGIGIPLSADFISSVYFIPLIPFALLFKLSHFNFFYLDLFFVLRYMLMSLGMYLFLRSFKLDKIICFIGALAFFSSGYFIYIPAINHHNVDILLPFIGWAINNFYFSRKIKWIGISSLLLGLSMLGAMPESSIFILFFCAIYVLFLSFFYIDIKKIKFFLLGSSIILGGLLLSAILYIPGLQLILEGLSIHHNGGVIQKSIEWKNIILFILPKLFGGIGYYVTNFKDKLDFSSSNWNYLGFIIPYFFIISISSLIKLIINTKKEPLAKFFFFFFILTSILLLQNYSLIHFYLFEQLPVFYQTQFTKYSSTLINFSMITVAAFSLHYFIKKRSKNVLIIYAFFIGILLLINYHYRDIIFHNPYYQPRLGLAPNIFNAIIMITFITICLYIIKNTKALLLILFVVILAEFYMYFPKQGDQRRMDSLRTPPAISFLQKRNDHSFRILGTENILFPNLSTIYDLSDIRILDPLWIDRYYLYMKNFFAEPDTFRITGIKENIATQSANIVTNPYFDMLSVKYILSYNKIETIAIENNLIDAVVKQNPKALFLNKTIFDINKDAKQVLFEHAPNDISVLVEKPVGTKYLIVFPALSPNLFGKKEGDGVRFISKVYVGGSLIDSQEVIIDASNKKSDQKWFTMKLGPFPSSEETYNFTLELITDPLTNNAYDWAGWGGFEWDTDLNKTINKYKPVYDKEIKIYENKDFVPRLRFINKTICVDPNKAKKNDYNYIVELMKQHKSDIKQLAIVESNNCQNTNYDPNNAKIISQKFDDQEVSFTYSSSEDQYGILSDTYYPGWNIYINGKKEVIDPVDLAFRGFKLPKGNNVKVRIVYEPWTVKIGLLITLITLGGAIYISFKKSKLN